MVAEGGFGKSLGREEGFDYVRSLHQSQPTLGALVRTALLFAVEHPADLVVPLLALLALNPLHI